MSRVGRDLKQGLGDGAKQESLEEAWVLQPQGSESLGNGEDHVAVGYRQQFLGLLVQPAIASGRLALGTVPVATGVERDQPMSARVALFQPTPESGGAAGADVMESFPLGRRDGVPPAAQEMPSILAKDIGDFQPMFTHRCRPSSRE
jgi:hypothetical protein